MPELVVHHLPGAWGLPSVSPFCLKLDVYLRLAGIPHRGVVDGTPFGAPKGKLPYIEHEGRKIGDSGFIIEYLAERFGRDPDAALTAAERGAALALRRMIEENLYWTLVYDRWMVAENWPVTRAAVLGAIPVPARSVVAPIARRGVRRQLRGHGMGLHAPEEIHAIGRRDIGAISDFLGDKPFLMGEQPTGIDAIAYGILANILLVPVASPVKDEGLRRTNLVAWLERFRERTFDGGK